MKGRDSGEEKLGEKEKVWKLIGKMKDCEKEG